MGNDGERPSEQGFLEPVGPLSADQIEQACEAAFANAVDLLEEADLLRAAAKTRERQPETLATFGLLPRMYSA